MLAAAKGGIQAALWQYCAPLARSGKFGNGEDCERRWIEPWVRRLLVTPDMHRIHHSVVEKERNSNYGFCLSIWDRLLGTYTAAAQGEPDIGLAGWRDRQTIATLPGVLGMPFGMKGGAR